MTKYRIRLKAGRILGPFEKRQLFELKAKGHIRGNEEAQVFPTGAWAPMSTFDFYSELIDESRTVVDSRVPEHIEDTFVIDLTKLRNQKQEMEIEEYDRAILPAVEELTETVRMSYEKQNASIGKSEIQNSSPVADVTSVNEQSTPTLDELELLFEIGPIEKTDNQNKTIINPIAQQDIEKMRKLQREAEAKIAEEEAQKKKAHEEAEALALMISQEGLPVSADESTQMISLDRSGLLQEAREAEQDIEFEFKKVQKDKLREQTEYREEEAESERIEKKKKKRIIIVIASLVLSFAVFFPDETPKKPTFKHINPQIVFPIPYDQSDERKSAAEFKRGLEVFNTGTYTNLIKAGINFKSSYENNLENSQALNFMVRAYAEELNHSKNKLADAQTIFKIIQSKRPFLIQDPNGVIGLNLFYMAINKPDAAIDVVQKYLKLRPKNVTQDLFAVYVRSLIRQGKLDLAKQFYSALIKAPDKNRYTYAALIEYSLLNQEKDRALEYVDEALKKNPKNVSFYLTKAELLLKERKLEPAIEVLKKTDLLNLENNDTNRSKFYELKGLVFVLQNKPKKAAEFFGRSLKLNESDELRVKLSDLKTSGGKLENADKIIMESKAVKFLIQAKDFFEKRNYDLALSSAIKATDAYPGHISSELFLSKVQLRLGLTQQGLKTIEDLVGKYPEDKTVNLALIEAYVDTYKFNDAKKRIQIVSSSDYRDSWEYASVNAKLHLKMGDILQAMSWLKNAISLNPLNDADIFSLAQILLKKANFDAARMLLNTCMELDPVNADYRLAYARLIYETQDDLAAIGYLLSLKEDFGEDPKIMSEIAIFYYRSGKVKDFEDYKNKLEKEHSTDKALYQFLIKAALLDDKTSDVPPLVEKLIAVEPGELEYMMTAGRVLFESGKIADAAKWFARVRSKMPSYPKVHYFMAKIDFLSNDLDSALKQIEEGMKANGENDDDLVLKAQVFQAREKFVDAENLYKKAQKINPKSYDAIIGLADLSTKRNNHDLALDLYKRAMKLRQDEPLVHKKIGDVYRQLGQGALAIESYKLYLEMDPESPQKSNLEAYIKLMQ
jgi:tetratricopeptide (TPR) repeat protein